MRFTKIICTLGPASKTEGDIRKLITCGMNIARVNLSHGSEEQHLETIRLLKKINEDLRQSANPPMCIGILLDTKGAEVRTADVKVPLVIKAGEEVVFSHRPLPREKRTIVMVNHENFYADVREAKEILIDNGLLSFDIVSERSSDGTVVARARQDGTIGSRRHVNLPGGNLSDPSITPKDWEDIALAAKEGVDFLALSFVRTASDVDEVRKYLEQQGAHIQLISKIEARQAVRNIREIVAASDGIMIARGDLGVEVPFETVPAIQDDIVALCRQSGKPVIVATQMLESMITEPIPTRAEVTDIAHAATTRADATMLSGETAGGKFPFDAVIAMDHVLLATEEHLLSTPLKDEFPSKNEREARAHAAVTLAQTTNASALFVMTRSGQTAREIARFRPTVPIIAFTDSAETQRSLQLMYGVVPIFSAFSTDPEESVSTAKNEGMRLGVLHRGDRIVLVSDTLANKQSVNTIQVRRVD
ncbi:MAG: pyruvate kinase [Candidatus Peribacteraceae bacterium]